MAVGLTGKGEGSHRRPKDHKGKVLKLARERLERATEFVNSVTRDAVFPCLPAEGSPKRSPKPPDLFFLLKFDFCGGDGGKSIGAHDSRELNEFGFPTLVEERSGEGGGPTEFSN
jgi:hypothetical protein